jgi:TonB family protein
MRYRLAIFLMLIATCPAMMCVDKQSTERKVVQRVLPVYPELARSANISGTVKLLVMVAPNGAVKSVQPMGGNPLLIKAAQDAVTNWKFAPASEETREPVELHFAPY